jgi:DNA-binding LacI/PurR family transcriptional regulator
MNCDLTKQEQIASWITSRVISGEMGSGDMIPPEIAIAERFQVNRSTVSKALDPLKKAGVLLRRPGKGSFVAKEARTRLQAATEVSMATEVNSRPPRVAVLGVVDRFKPDYLEREAWRIQRAFERKISQLSQGVSVSFHNLYSKEGHFDVNKLMDGFVRAAIQGVCLVEDSIPHDDLAALICAMKVARMPFVIAATDSRREWVDRVSCSDHEIGLIAARHLHDLGHKCFAFVAPDFDFAWIRQRFAGFQAYLLNKGVAAEDILCIHDDHDSPDSWPVSAADCGWRCGQQVFANRKVTAIFAVSDLIAVGMLQVADTMGVQIPDDVSLVGVDNVNTLMPNITSIPLPFEEIGEASASLLLKKVADPQSRRQAEQIFVFPEIIERLTTGAPRSA